MKNISISKIRIDGGTQNRVQLNEETVAEYSDAITGGAKFPPVTVFFDGSDYWLADGFHRYHAHRKIGALDIDSDVREGTKRDAILHSVGANAAHGLRRTNLDKRQSIETLLSDEEWSQWSDNQIAKACSVSQSTVSRIRLDRSSLMQSISDHRSRTYTNKHGQVAQMDVSRIGQQPQAQVIPIKPSQDADIESEIMGDFDPVSELEEAHKEIDRLQAQIKAMCKDDLAKQLQKEVETRQGVEARLAQEMDRANRFDTELRKYGKFAAELRKTLRVETNSQVLVRIRAVMEAA
jgi:hypothetical protein